MRFGLIARSETDRGLGIQTFAMHENLHPDKTLVVLVPQSGFASHPENYPGATFVTLTDDGLDERTVRTWLRGLDVVVTVETFYDWQIILWAYEEGVRTVVHGNPEFWMESNPQPDVWWWPTTWRLDKLPVGPVVPVPIEDHRLFTARNPHDGILSVVHIAGNAMADRNGTNVIHNAMRQVPYGVSVDIYAQTNVAQSKKVRTHKSVSDRWTMYNDHHALVIPRRYGGLCLPVQEAMACGLAVFMSDCSPNQTMWPVIPLASELSRVIPMQTGDVQTYDVTPNALANALKHYMHDRDGLAEYQERSRRWANQHRWSVLKDRYYDELHNAL